MSLRRLTPEQHGLLGERLDDVEAQMNAVIAAQHETGDRFVQGENSLGRTENESEINALALAALFRERKKILKILHGRRLVLGRSAYVQSLTEREV